MPSQVQLGDLSKYGEEDAVSIVSMLFGVAPIPRRRQSLVAVDPIMVYRGLRHSF